MLALQRALRNGCSLVILLRASHIKQPALGRAWPQKAMLTPSEQQVSFYKSDNFMRSWAKQDGRVCEEDVVLSMSKPPPPVRGALPTPTQEKTKEVPVRERASDDPYMNTCLVQSAQPKPLRVPLDAFRVG